MATVFSDTEEQEQRALAKQAVKMEAEKQHQLEKLIQERERSHQEGICQLEVCKDTGNL